VTGLPSVIGDLAAVAGVSRVVSALVDFVKETLPEDATRAMIRIIIERFGPDLVRGELDQYDVARAVADAAETVKYGPTK
jgi:hypothetical protein